jgi:anti-anti-sigma factor
LSERTTVLRQLKIRTQETGSDTPYLLTVLEGQLDAYNSPQAQSQLLREIRSTSQSVVLDCRGLIHMASAGIGLFLVLQREVLSHGQTLYIAGMPERIQSVFEILGLKQSFRFVGEPPRGAATGTSPSGGPRGGTRHEAAFPRTVPCTACSTKLKARASGRYRCPRCKTPLQVAENGAVETLQGSSQRR